MTPTTLKAASLVLGVRVDRVDFSRATWAMCYPDHIQIADWIPDPCYPSVLAHCLYHVIRDTWATGFYPCRGLACTCPAEIVANQFGQILTCGLGSRFA